MTHCSGWLLSVLLLAQQDPIVRTTVPLVTVPVSVTDESGRLVRGLGKADFVLLDGGRRRDFDVDLLNERVSLVLLVQSSASTAAALAKLNEVTGLFEPLLAGEGGEMALIAYNDSASLISPFGAAASILSKSIRALRAEGRGAVLLDAVGDAIHMLSERPRERRRIVLVIGEAKDRGSRAALGTVLREAQRHDVTIYPLTYSPTLTSFTAKAGVIALSGAQSQMGAFNPGAMLTELARLSKTDTAASLAAHTGGVKKSFLKRDTLEQALQQVGEEIHTQYVLAFQPLDPASEEFRPIQVRSKSGKAWQIRARAGYWAVLP